MIMEAARAMLHDQDLPMHLRAEASRTSVYVQNHTPHRVLKNKTPEEVFFSKKPEVSHLRIFSCLVYIHILKEKRTKLDPSGKKGIFVGYSESSNAYKIYFPGFKNIDINRDVTFDEDSTYFRSMTTPIQEDEELEETRAQGMEIGEAIPEDHEDHDMAEPQEPVETILEKDSHKRKPAWAQELVREAERYGALEGIHRERKREKPRNRYVDLLSDIIDKEPSTYEEDVEKK